MTEESVAPSFKVYTISRSDLSTESGNMLCHNVLRQEYIANAKSRGVNNTWNIKIKIDVGGTRVTKNIVLPCVWLCPLCCADD